MHCVSSLPTQGAQRGRQARWLPLPLRRRRPPHHASAPPVRLLRLRVSPWPLRKLPRRTSSSWNWITSKTPRPMRNSEFRRRSRGPWWGICTLPLVPARSRWQFSVLTVRSLTSKSNRLDYPGESEGDSSGFSA